MMRWKCLVLVLMTAAAPANAQRAGSGVQPAPQDRERVAAHAHATTGPIRVDGELTEPAWSAAVPVTGFTQLDPMEGAPSSAATEVRILFDGDALYIGARLRDAEPVTRRLGRRDMDPSGSDWLRVSLDTHRDRRTAYRFEVNPSGVRRDAQLTGDAQNRSWDPVWETATRIEEGGWTVEMRIPFTSLRFGSDVEQVWGLQLERYIHRLQEQSVFAFTPKSQAGGIAAFGDLIGLRGIEQGRGVELLPYVVGTGEFVNAGSNPYSDGSEQTLSAGLDARVRVTSGVTLVGTLNPDFGQVEVDPAVINLTAFETSFEEKRPFFVEGAGNFGFGGGPPGPWPTPNLFYSRRIGRAPQLRPPTSAADVPGSTSILGAAKLTGRTRGGWSIGVLEAVTQAEYARYRDSESNDARVLVEPAANSFIGRAQREYDDGRGSVGVIATALNRSLADDAATAALRSSAYAGGVDFRRESADRSWGVSGAVAGSRIAGSTAAITAVQRSPVRYFGRPDAEHLEIDEDATALAGYMAQLRVQKRAGAHVLADIAASVVSPGLEVNDLGFQSRADRMGVNGSVSYRENRPGTVLRSWSIGAMANLGRNYGGDWIDKWTNLSATMQHVSYWTLILGSGYEAERANDRLTRGGPLAAAPAAWNYGGLLMSDPRRALSGSVRARAEADASGMWENQFATSLTLRPAPRWNLSIGPSFMELYNPAQYVTRVGDETALATYGVRYFFAPLRYSELSLETRLNVSFTPDLTLELFAQPLLSTAAFAQPREFTTPGAYAFRDHDDAERVQTQRGAAWRLDPDGPGPAGTLQLPDPDFRAHSLRGNAVLRWEWRAGSTLFLAWQQGRVAGGDSGGALGVRDFESLLRADADHVFAVKLSYWLSPGG